MFFLDLALDSRSDLARDVAQVKRAKSMGKLDLPPVAVR